MIVEFWLDDEYLEREVNPGVGEWRMWRVHSSQGRE